MIARPKLDPRMSRKCNRAELERVLRLTPERDRWPLVEEVMRQLADERELGVTTQLASVRVP